jgi:uncharacterized protein YukE
MGANIENVDYENMIKVANEIATEASKLNEDVSQAYQDMKEMSSDWYGNSYDQFANSANQYIAELEKCFRFIVTEGPAELAAKARSYAKGNLTVTNNTGNQSPKSIDAVPLTNKGTKLRFRSSSIASDRSVIESKFTSAEGECDTIVSKLESIEWESVAGNYTKNELKRRVNSVKEIIQLIKGSLKTIIDQQQATIDLLEGAAEAVEAGKEITLDIIDSAQNIAENLVNNIQDAASATWTSLTGND